MGCFACNNNNIITYLYGNATKSFKKFESNYSVNLKSFIFTNDKFVVFNDTKAIIPVRFLKENTDKLDLRRLYEYSIKKQILDNIISIFKFKFENANHIIKSNEDFIFDVINPYKERSRMITYPENDDFTHLITITYQNLLTNSIFEIIERNRQIIKKVNRGIRRLREYIKKWLRDRLKRVIKDREELNRTVRKKTREIFNYFKVYELHESNYIHAHMLIKLPAFIRNMPFQEIIRKFAKWFDTAENGIDIKYLKKGKETAKRYVVKYLMKQFTNDNLFYVMNEYGEIYHFIKTSAIIRNDIKRMTSRSRNVKVKKYKPLIKFEKIENKNKEEIKHFDLVELEIMQKNYEEFKEIIAEFEEFKKQRERNRIKWKEPEEPEEIDWVDF
ncbi:MAG: hypothetical protein JHC31_12230 [Sulfurihydrogenibium sp.]|jgi:hypothetical protein|nr:hypothetical protein [Sulfurihydrogenibium sp.]MBX0312519.1 hypothetical protein [Sulfurihydrogenibium sp.]